MPGECNCVLTNRGRKATGTVLFWKGDAILKLFGKKGKMIVPSFLKEAGVT